MPLTAQSNPAVQTTLKQAAVHIWEKLVNQAVYSL